MKNSAHEFIFTIALIVPPHETQEVSPCSEVIGMPKEEKHHTATTFQQIEPSELN